MEVRPKRITNSGDGSGYVTNLVNATQTYTTDTVP
jgi:hypothetical protein